jgi:hypothetical protein
MSPVTTWQLRGRMKKVQAAQLNRPLGVFRYSASIWETLTAGSSALPREAARRRPEPAPPSANHAG